MTSTAGTFSSVHLRERDKILEEKHAKELAALERKIERLKWSNNDTLKQLHEAQTRGIRLAQSLGFQDITEAQVAINTADNETPYRECVERVETLERALGAEQERNEELGERVRLLEKEREELKVSLSAEQNRTEPKPDALEGKLIAEKASQDLKDLQSRFDALLDVKERAATRYKADYAKWRNFNKWLFKEGDPNEKGISEAETKRREFIILLRKEKILATFGMDEETNKAILTSGVPLAGVMNVEDDKENLVTPAPLMRKRRLETPMTTTSTVVGSPSTTAKLPSATPTLKKLLYKFPVQDTSPSSSPSIFQDNSAVKSTRQPLTLQPISQRNALTRSSLRLNRASSDTEDDSQAIGQYPAPINIGPFKVPCVPSESPPTSPVALPSSQTEPDSQSQVCPFPELLFKKPPVPPHPGPPPPISVLRVRRVDIGRDVVARDAESLQPTKVRKISGPAALSTPTRTNVSPVKIKTESGVASDKGKGKENAMPLLSSTTASADAKRLGDYSAFKGRGRYAKEAASNKDTINAQYVIDASRNGGRDFQFDEVVRNKEHRKHMEAGDCECCRDYYEAVGPLPDRLKPPAWRSPESTPAKSSKHDISSRRNAISRHRHHWERAKTPPGYWNIGFPDTQEAEEINQQAKEMHAKKMAKVADEAAREEGGRYKKRV